MALSYKERRPRIPFAKFNCDKHLNFCHSKSIPIFPYMVLYIKKHPLVYHGDRTYVEIKKFLENKLNKTPMNANID
jgi:hypothetical protein